jgi:hypothetical protein
MSANCIPSLLDHIKNINYVSYRDSNIEIYWKGSIFNFIITKPSLNLNFDSEDNFSVHCFHDDVSIESGKFNLSDVEISQFICARVTYTIFKDKNKDKYRLYVRVYNSTKKGYPLIFEGNIFNKVLKHNELNFTKSGSNKSTDHGLFDTSNSSDDTEEDNYLPEKDKLLEKFEIHNDVKKRMSDDKISPCTIYPNSFYQKNNCDRFVQCNRNDRPKQFNQSPQFNGYGQNQQFNQSPQFNGYGQNQQFNSSSQFRVFQSNVPLPYNWMN